MGQRKHKELSIHSGIKAEKLIEWLQSAIQEGLTDIDVDVTTGYYDDIDDVVLEASEAPKWRPQ